MLHNLVEASLCPYLAPVDEGQENHAGYGSCVEAEPKGIHLFREHLPARAHHCLGIHEYVRQSDSQARQERIVCEG